MSVFASIIKIYLNVSNTRNKIFGGDLEKMHKQIILYPPKTIIKNNNVEEENIKGVNVCWVNKQFSKKGVIIYLHGGIYVFGPVALQWRYIIKLSKMSGMTAIVIHYRLLPDNSYPD